MRLEAPLRREHEIGGPYNTLCRLAAEGVAAMYDAEQHLFCNTYLRTADGMVRQGHSPRYTMMTVLGLARYERCGGTSPVPVLPIVEHLLQNPGWVAGAGDLGLLLWTCADLLPGRVPELYRNLRANEALSTFPDGQQGFSMEVAWYLTGLVACCEAGYRDLAGLPEQVAAARSILARNCGATGIYGHRSGNSGIAGSMRRRIGSFADQVYPTMALARLSAVFGDEDAREAAVLTATTMCRLQGSFGEWSWHYDASTGRVVNRYPVYSVHQHGMGPMMLYAVSDAAGSCFGEAIQLSVGWISGHNELNRNFIEPSLQLIWRCVYLPAAAQYADAALRFTGIRRGPSPATIHTRYECRPYELGWLLYGLSGRTA